MIMEDTKMIQETKPGQVEETKPGRAEETIEFDTDKYPDTTPEDFLVSTEVCCKEEVPGILTTKSYIADAINALEATRPEERGELSRRFAICITDLERVFAYYHTYICDCSLPEAI